ncbi:hypothetical protein AHAS_Ahas01G0091600 [Arachis hypogaea]
MVLWRAYPAGIVMSPTQQGHALCKCEATKGGWPRCGIMLKVFGDVVTFDATYKKNVYLSPLVVSSGVNHHNQTVVFATALVADKKEERYVWLFQQLQTAMKGKASVSIITDSDRQMKSAIEQVFPEAHH